MAEQREQKYWSHNAGQKGRNWVRAFQDRDGKYNVEWMEPVTDETTGEQVWEANRHGVLQPKSRKVRARLKGVTDPEVARKRADTIAARFLDEQTTSVRSRDHLVASIVVPGEGVLAGDLIDYYLKEVTPEKKESKQGHDCRAARLFKQHLAGVRANQLDRTHWDSFIAARRRGEFPSFDPVGPRQVTYDLKFMIAVLGWGLGAADAQGTVYLERHPWSRERRKALNMRFPTGGSPRRPSMTDEVRDGLIRHSPNPQFAAALHVGRHTVSRNSSVRHLQWSDVDLENRTVRWRGEFDKNGQEVVVPLPPVAVAALRGLPRGIGEAWVFPAAMDKAKPTPRHTFQTWLRRAKARLLASIADPVRKRRLEQQMEGLGFHGEKRAGVRDQRFRNLAPKIQEAIARTNHETLRKIYDDVGLDEIALAMREQGLLEDSADELAAVRWQQNKK